MIPLNCFLDTTNDQLVFTLPGAEGSPDVVVLTLDLDTLSTAEKHRLRHVRNEGQTQRPATAKTATRGVG